MDILFLGVILTAEYALDLIDTMAHNMTYLAFHIMAFVVTYITLLSDVYVVTAVSFHSKLKSRR